MLYLLPEKCVGFFVLVHLLLPSRALKVPVHLQEVLEIVKGKDSKCLIDDEHGKKAKLHIYIGCQPNFASCCRDRTVLEYVKLVLELHQVLVSFYFEADLLLELKIRADGL